MADLPTVLAFGLAGLAVVVWTAVLVLALRRRAPRSIPFVAADVPSGPIVPAADLIKATWTPVVDRRHPEPWWIGHRHHVAFRPVNLAPVGDRTAVDEVRRVTEDVAS